MDTKELRLQDYLNSIREIVVEVEPDKGGLGRHNLCVLVISNNYSLLGDIHMEDVNNQESSESGKASSMCSNNYVD